MRLSGILLVAMLASCAPGGAEAYKLYRTSAVGPEEYEVATFDVREGRGYNRENCEAARMLFQNQPGVTVRYRCQQIR